MYVTMPSYKILEIPNDILLGAVKKALREGHTCTISVKGRSMRPFLEDKRDRVILAPITAPLLPGDAVLAEIREDTYVLHRIIGINGNIVTLMGDGNIKGTETCRAEDICGIVTRYLHPRLSFSATNMATRRAVRMWRALLPIRYPLLKLYSLLRKIHLV